MATITGQRASSTLPRRDTPRDAEPVSAYDDLADSAQSAWSAWRFVTPSLAGTPHVRISKDGGRTYPARHVRPLPAEPPGQPCTVPVYDAGSASGRILVLDLDVARGADPAAEVAAQAEAFGELVARLGGRVFADVAPGGGRHVFVLFAAALPWRELYNLVRAVALRFPPSTPARTPRSAGRSALPAPGRSGAAGGCSRRR